MRMNFYNHPNSVSFKSHSISVTFKFCAVLVALCSLEPRSSKVRLIVLLSNRMTSSIHAPNDVIKDTFDI